MRSIGGLRKVQISRVAPVFFSKGQSLFDDSLEDQLFLGKELPLHPLIL